MITKYDLDKNKIRKIISEEIDSTGNYFTKNQRNILEEGFFDWLSELIGSLKDMLSQAAPKVDESLKADIKGINTAFTTGKAEDVEAAIVKLEATIADLKVKLEQMKKKAPAAGAAGAPAAGAQAK
jgi:flagellar capping protein FliD